MNAPPPPPPTVGNNTSYSLRNTSDYKYIRSNTQLYYNSFLPSVVRDWNELPHTTRNAPSISSFKRSLNSTPIGVPLFYLDGKRIGQIYHSRLRMDCSSLNHHIYSKNIIDSPLCICGRPETTKHYLFECNRFNKLHQEMMQSISELCEPTLNALLYGVTDLSARQIGSSSSSYRSIYQGLNDSNKLPLSNYSLTLRFTNY